jgi:tetratricopeptide (TPR) repeat protein
MRIMGSVYPIRHGRFALVLAAALLAVPALLAGAADETAAETIEETAPGAIDEAWAAYDRGDWETARALFGALADAGDPEAQYALGSMLSNGFGGEIDHAEAARRFGEAAATGHAEAASALGYQYDFGLGLPQNRDLAEYWYRRAADGGSLLGMNNLAYSWIEQRRNLRAALDMIREVVAAGYVDSATLDTLGWGLYELGAYPEAVPPLCQAALLEPGHPEIRVHLGDAYWRAGRAADARQQWQAALELEANPDQLSIGGSHFLHAQPRGEWRRMVADRIANGVPGANAPRADIGADGIERSFTDECAIPVS